MTSVVTVAEPSTTVTVTGDEQVVVVTETVVETVELGVSGPQGPPGAAGAAPQSYHYETVSLLTVHTVNHNLGYRPALAQCIDDAGTNRHPTIEHVDENTLTMEFVGPTAIESADFS